MVFICGMTNSTGTRYPMDMGAGMNFYPRVRIQISNRNLFAGGRVIALPDPLPSLQLDPLIRLWIVISLLVFLRQLRSSKFYNHHINLTTIDFNCPKMDGCN
jgi:hypothetical protein